MIRIEKHLWTMQSVMSLKKTDDHNTQSDQVSEIIYGSTSLQFKPSLCLKGYGLTPQSTIKQNGVYSCWRVPLLLYRPPSKIVIVSIAGNLKRCGFRDTFCVSQ